MDKQANPDFATKLAYTIIYIGIMSVAGYYCFKFIDEFESIEWEKSKVEIIPQKIGGVLICNWHRSMDLHSSDISIGYYYKSGLDSARRIGVGSFHAINWEPIDQIINIGNWSYLLTGDGFRGQMLLYGKLSDTSEWKEFYLSPDSVNNDPNWTLKNNDNLELYGYANFNSYSRLLVQCFNPSKKLMKVTAETYRHKKRVDSELIYSLDQSTGIPKLIRVIVKE